MASDGREAPSSTESHRVDGTNFTDMTCSLETGVSSVPNTSTLKTTAAEAEEDTDGVDVCQFFLKGKCRFGQRCRLAHSDPSIDDPGVVSADQDDKDEKMEKHKKKMNKAAQPKYEAQEMNKKPRMRTADEVISRILWDPSVDSSEFVVGYVDRFLGVLERPFNDFSWDTNPCDCDYSAELALPRHRIQYFTYRGHRVWDRHTRTDRVFGSTGQSLAPPFGGEEEVKDIHETVQEQTEESETEVVAHSYNTRVGEEESSELNIETEDSAQSAGKANTHTSQEQRGSRGVTEETAVRPEFSTDQMSLYPREGAKVKQDAEEAPLVELQGSVEGNEDDLIHLDTLDISQACSLLEQKDEKPGGRPPKKRPTHFITFRANTPAILSCFQQLQEEITALIPSSAPHWMSSSSLHVTLCLLVLHGPAEIAAAGEILRQFAQLDRNPPVAVTFPVKLKHFNGKVLYLSPQPQLHLQQLNSGLQEAYRKEGWLHRHSYNPRYHLTLAKVEYKEEDRIFEGVGDLKVGKGLNFGRLPVNTLHLCAMGGSKIDGFYETLCTVTLR